MLSDEATELEHVYSRLPISRESEVATTALDNGQYHHPHYTPEGVLIPVVKEDPNGAPTACGVLVDLKEVQKHLPDEYDFNDLGSNLDQKTTCHTFPLAFTKTLGNFWASDHLQYYLKTFTSHVTEDIFAELSSDSGSDSNSDSNSNPRSNPHSQTHSDGDRAQPQIITRGSMQVYNELAHSTRSKDGKHDTQRGTMTGVLAGCHLNTQVLKRHYNTLRAGVDDIRPHKAYFNKVLSSGDGIGCRLEPTCTVRVSNLPLRLRTARHVY